MQNHTQNLIDTRTQMGAGRRLGTVPTSLTARVGVV